ncbi:MAG: hypothetical protein ACREOS_10505 [Candidatus Dormibacteraceae bacterium]
MSPERPAVEMGSVEALGGLGRILDRALRRLGDAGEEEVACRLAADGWALLAKAHPREAERFNATLHYLTRRRPLPRAAQTVLRRPGAADVGSDNLV